MAGLPFESSAVELKLASLRRRYRRMAPQASMWNDR